MTFLLSYSRTYIDGREDEFHINDIEDAFYTGFYRLVSECVEFISGQSTNMN